MNTLLHYHHLIPILAALALWELIWKGFALWRAGRNAQKAWFIVLLIINSVGLLSIIYLLLYPADTSK